MKKPSETKDLYERLNVSKTASEDEIKKSYRKLALNYHPDRNQNNKDSEEQFKSINEAYEILKDPNKRMQYDTFGTTSQQHYGFPGGGFKTTYTYKDDKGNVREMSQEEFEQIFGNMTKNFDDMFKGFDNIFENMFGGNQQSNKKRQSPLEEMLNEIFKGIDKDLEKEIKRQREEAELAKKMEEDLEKQKEEEKKKKSLKNKLKKLFKKS